MDIGQAVAELWRGQRVTRVGWNRPNLWVALHQPDAVSLMTLPFLFLATPGGDFIPWTCSQSDLLASDWEVV